MGSSYCRIIVRNIRIGYRNVRNGPRSDYLPVGNGRLPCQTRGLLSNRLYAVKWKNEDFLIVVAAILCHCLTPMLQLATSYYIKLIILPKLTKNQ